ncbi:MAG: hypothetical protein PSV23_10330 [Brevundimonas sp.]|uniref:hypothetical protein n=1 Tax=Brevundimonas sp. TaxID=1871086 RepID=UPI002489A5B6|nr:hypothetical protein [Brevundimonas sp.]MDI1327181.1 hypothetical protein [Brevundimonas sp.]
MLAPASSSITDMLRHTGANDAAAEGLVHIVSVTAVRDAVGERWGRHQSLVEDFVLRAFARNGREDDFIVPVNDTDFLLIQPGRTPMAALSRSSQLLRETLTFFLGTVEAENINISVVDRIGEQGLETTRASAEQIARAAQERPLDLAQSFDGSAPWERFGVPRPPRKAVTIRRPDGADIQTVFYLEPVWHVARGAVVSFLVRTVCVQRTPDGASEPCDTGELAPGAAAALTIQRLVFVRELLGSEAAPGLAIVVHVPISMTCLSYSGTRTSVLSELRRLVEGEQRHKLIIELDHVPDALPQSRLSEALAQVRPYARAVLVRVGTLNCDLGSWARTGAMGVVHDLEAAGAARAEKETLKQLAVFVMRAQAAGLSAGLYGVRSRSLVIGAWGAGVKHLSGDYIVSRLGNEPVAQRFEIADLYRARADQRNAS